MPNLINHRPRPGRGRGHTATGRSKRGERFLKLEHWFLKSEAWRSLTPPARAIYVEIALRYNSFNNGEISLSVREAARLVHVAKDTATKAIRELEAKGFIRRHVCGSFNWKLRHATTWILTTYEFDGRPATKDFARWAPSKTELGPKSGRHCPKRGTPAMKAGLADRFAVPTLGPWGRLSPGPRSQTAARI